MLGHPISDPRDTLQKFYAAYVTFSIKMKLFYSLQFFYYLLTFAYLEHLAPG